VHAISTFNTLNEEGRRVAVALVCRSPLTRDDVCVYTDELLLGEGGQEAEARLAAGLAREDAAVAAALAAPGSVRLLADGRYAAAAAGGGPAPPESASVSGEQWAAGRFGGGGGDGGASISAVTAPSAPPTVMYGYPGAVPKDAVLVTLDEAGRRARAAARTVR
jgi:hypothetical protein